MIMTSKTAELRNYWLNRIDQLGLEVCHCDSTLKNFPNLTWSYSDYYTNIFLYLEISQLALPYQFASDYASIIYAQRNDVRIRNTKANQFTKFNQYDFHYYSVAERDVQKAEYYVVRYLEGVPEDKRPAMESFYDCYLSVLHSEIAMRAGNGELARRKMGHVFETFPKLTPVFRNLFMYNIDVSHLTRLI